MTDIIAGGIMLAIFAFLWKYPEYRKKQKLLNQYGHPLLINRCLSDRISTICMFIDCDDMPKLSAHELQTIETWAREGKIITQTVSDGYFKQTGKKVFDVINENEGEF